MHEGTDIFAPYGTPVLSACYGYVDLIGWNRLGGWRIGLRAVDNHYFYYAHLSSFAKGVRAYGQANAQPAGMNPYGSPLAQVMQADRFVDQQEATPSYYRYASSTPYGQPSPGYAFAQPPYSY